MKKFVIGSLVFVSICANATSVGTAQSLINDNFEPKDCGTVTKVVQRNGGGELAICSNKEVFMLTGNRKLPLMKCSVLDKYRAMGIDLGVTTKQCLGV